MKRCRLTWEVGIHCYGLVCSKLGEPSDTEGVFTCEVSVTKALGVTEDSVRGDGYNYC